GCALEKHPGVERPKDLRPPVKCASRKHPYHVIEVREPFAVNNLIDGRAIASQILGELAGRVAALKQRGVVPGLAFVRVGEDPASKVYVGRKEKACAELGIVSETHVLPEKTSEAE